MTASTAAVPKNAERLNALMRPADDVPWSASAKGLLDAIVEERDPVGALAYVFANKPFAYWSGPATPTGDFPPPFDTKPGGRDRADAEAFEHDPKIQQRYEAVVAQIRADEPDARERAERALAFLESVKSRFGRAFVLDEMLKNEAFVSSATPVTGEVPFNEPLSDGEWEDILWRNRAVIGRLIGIGASNAIKMNAARGAAVLSVLSEVPDEFERAVVLGAFLDNVRRVPVQALEVGIPLPGGFLEKLRDLVAKIRETAEQGKPCPVCHKVHEQNVEHEDE